MATDISLVGNVVQFTVDGGQPKAYSSSIEYRYYFNAAGTIITIRNEFDTYNIPLADLRVAGAGTAPASAAAAYTALSTVFPDTGSAGGGGESLLQTATVTLTDAQIKALPTTPIQVVAAPGVNKFISLVQGIIILDNVAGGYTNITGGATTIIYFGVGNPLQTASSLYIESDMGDFEFPSTSPFPIIFSPPANIGTGTYAAAGPGDADTVDNKAMYISGANTGSFTGGNAANTLKVTVYYIIADL